MLETFSVQSVKIIEYAKKIAKEMGSSIVGSEHLLIAMYNTQDTICHFLLFELKIKLEDLKTALSKMQIIRKTIVKNSIFSKRFEDIILNAKEIAKESKSDYVYDEHIFYSLLELKGSVAFEVLEYLNVDTNELLDDIEEIFNLFSEDETSKEETTNLTFLKPVNNSVYAHPYIRRKDYIEQIIYILKKKQKNNPLIIGNAGVGKSAIIQGLSKVLKNELIYELDLGSAVAGTKYRGELEEKLLNALEYASNKKAILFIDEIHNIVGAGSNDGSLDVANILKPYLTKSNIKVIGATTLTEYHKFIAKDKALSRRFQNIFIDEPSKEETLKILLKIKKYYEEYHHVKYSVPLLKLIINKCEKYIPTRSFPDKAIDVVDEVGAISLYKNEPNLYKLIDKVIYSINGIRPKRKKEIIKMKLKYKEIKPYYLKYISMKENRPNIVVIKAKKGFLLKDLEEDLKKIFGIKNENILEIDLDSYTDHTSLNNLIGSSKGYVGYEQGGLVYEHILKYPISVVYFKNMKNAHISITSYIKKIFEKEFEFDNKGRKVFFSNTIFIYDDFNKKYSSLGFENKKNAKDDDCFDIEVGINEYASSKKNNKYLELKKNK